MKVVAILYGKKQGVKEASAIVATNNVASQNMIKKMVLKSPQNGHIMKSLVKFTA
jgi:hypothetical protein